MLTIEVEASQASARGRKAALSARRHAQFRRMSAKTAEKVLPPKAFKGR
jgi:hypothetical protein